MTLEPFQQRVDGLFTTAFALPFDKRASFLDQACVNDPPEVRAAVERLLAHDQAAEADKGFLRNPPLADLAAPFRQALDEPVQSDSDEARAAGRGERQRDVPSAEADRNLFFGIIALQMDFVTKDQLVAAMHAWVLSKSTPLGEIMVQQRVLKPADRSMLEAMVQRHVELHHNDPEQSLASLSSIGSLRHQLASLDDVDVERSLAQVSAARGADPDRTASWSVGESTSKGERFRVLRPHSKGGLGEVFVARDSELNREVALKQIQEWHADNPASRARFVLEGEITGGLEHPGIVPVYGLGHDGQGRPFYAMRFIKGHSLKEAIKQFHEAAASNMDPGQRALEFRGLLGRFTDVCNAVAFAHSRGVLHRDLKPGNVMLGDFGETLVVDWGLAKVVGRSESDAASDEKTLRPSAQSGSTPTQMGQALGTPPYMSPEQAAGKLELLGPTSDVYSLGATLYSLLTGKAPFDSNDPEIATKIRDGRFPWPREVNPRAPEALEAVCVKAMALRQADRYQSPRAMAEDISRWLGDEPVSAWAEPMSRRIGRWARKHRMQVAAVMGVLVTAIVALVVAVILLNQKAEVIEQKSQEIAKEKESVEQSLARESKAKRDLEVALENETQANVRTTEAVLRASEEKLRADVAKNEAKRATRHRYVAQMNVAQRAGDEGKTGTMLQLLDGLRRHDGDAIGFDWHYLWNLTRRGQEFTTHEARSQVAFSPDGTQIAAITPVGPGACEISLWNVASGDEVQRLVGHSQAITTISFTPDGRRLASAGNDGSVRLWDLGTGSEIFVKDLIKPGIRLALNHDGTLLATSVESGEVTLWSGVDGERVAVLDQQGTGPIAFRPDGQCLAMGDRNGDVVIRSIADGSETLRIKTGGHPSCIVFNPTASRVLTTGLLAPIGASAALLRDAEAIHVWDLNGGARVQSLYAHTGSVNSLAFSPDGILLASAGDDGTIRIWDVATNRAMRMFVGHGTPVTSIAFSPDNHHVASAGSSIRVWDVRQDQNSLVLKDAKGRIRDVAISPDGTRVATASSDVIRIRDEATGDEVLTVTDSETHFTAVSFDLTGDRIATGDFTGRVKIWDAQTGNIQFSAARSHPERITDLDFSQHGVLASASADKVVHLLSEADGTLVRSIERPIRPKGGMTLNVHGRQQPSANTKLDFAPDGKRLAIACQDGDFSVHEVSTGAEVFVVRERPRSSIGTLERMAATGVPITVRVADERVTPLEELTPEVMSNPAIAFSPVDSLIASTNTNDTVTLWDANSGAELRVLRGHVAPVECLAFTTDGRRLATGSRDHMIHVWDVETGQMLITLRGHADWVSCLAFSRDDARLASGSLDETLRIWEAPQEPAAFPLKELARSFVDSGEISQATDLFGAIVGIQRDAFGPDSVELLKSNAELALLYRVSGRHADAIKLYDSVIRGWTKHLGKDHSHTLSAMSNLGLTYDLQGDPARAIEVFRECLKLRLAKLGASHPRTLLVMRNLGGAYQRAGHWDEATNVLGEAIQADPSNYQTWMPVVALLKALRENGKSDVALRFTETLVKTARERQVKIDYWISLVADLAIAYRRLGRSTEAIPLYEEALELKRELYGADDPKTLTAMHNLAMAYFQGGKIVEGIKLLETTVTARQEKLGRHDPNTLMSIIELGELYRRTGRPADAIPLLEEAVTAAKEVSGVEEERVLTAKNNLALAYNEHGQRDKALATLDEVIAEMRDRLGAEHHETLRTLTNRVDVLLASGDFKRAITECGAVLRTLVARLESERAPDDRQSLVQTLGIALGSVDRYTAQLSAEEEVANGRALYQTVIDALRTSAASGSSLLSAALTGYGKFLSARGKWQDAVTAFQECVQLRERDAPGNWSTFHVKGMLGEALLGAGELPQAEAVMLAAHQGLREHQEEIPVATRNEVIRQSLNRLSSLYDAKGDPQEAARWRAQIDAAE